MGCLYYFDLKLIKLLNLDHNVAYSCNFIYEMIKKRKSNYTKCNSEDLWYLDSKFLNIIMDTKLYKTNDSFYDLFYENKGIDWRTHYKIGFPKCMIILMIKSITMDRNLALLVIKFSYKDEGKKIDKVII
jgi:hypothetical protein